MVEVGHPNRERIEAQQLQALRSLLSQLVPANPFYTQKLEGCDLASDLPGLLKSLPFTTKQELVEDQAAHPPYGRNLTYPLERYSRYNQTSGTLGEPMRWLDTPESWSWMVDNWLRVFLACGVTSADRILFAFSFGPFLGFWTAFEAGTRLGCLCIPGGGMTSVARVRAALDNRVTVLCCTPTYALRLAEVAEAEGIDLSQGSVRLILVAGEPGGSIAGTRDRIERGWPRAKVRDHHGMTEVGPVSYECPERPGVLHIMEHAFIPEVIPSEAVRPSNGCESGELVLTNLGRVGSPLLRYRTGDLVRASRPNPCDCGSFEMALEGGVLGRVDDMVVVRGVNLHPSAVEDVLRRFPEVAEYRAEVRQTGPLTEVSLTVETLPDFADGTALGYRLAAALRDAFNLRIPVQTAAPGSLPRFELKAKRWVRLKEVGLE